MVTAPPCATCGVPLRWVVERTAWGCDRCKTLQAGAAPSTGPSQMSMPAYAPATPGMFAGGNARTPSVAPGSYTAPVSQPAAPPPSFGTLPGAGPSPFARPQPPYATPPGAQPPYVTPPAAPSPYATPPNAPSPYAPPSAQSPYAQAPYAPPYAPATPGAFAGPPSAPAAPAHGAPYAPYPPSAQPNAPYAPPMQSTAAVAATAPSRLQPTRQGSKKGLLIGGALIAVAGAGIAIAVVMSRGGSGGAGGVASRDELASLTLAAFSSGDVDALVKLAGPEDLQARFSDCKPPDNPDEADPKKQRELLEREYKKLIDEAKGAKAELVAITGDTKDTLEKGKEVGRCTMKTAVSMVAVKAKVKVTRGTKPAKEQEAEMTFTEVDGAWYLAMPPKLAPVVDCAGAIAKSMKASRDVLGKLELDDAAVSRLEKKMLEHCIENSWSDKVVDCIAKVTSDAETDACMKKLPGGQRDKLVKALTTIIEEELHAKAVAVATATPTKAVAPGDPLPPEEPGAATPASADDFPPICQDYGKELAKLATCRRLATSTHKQMQESFAALKQGWDEIPTKNAAMRESFERSCKTSLEAIVDLRKSCR